MIDILTIAATESHYIIGVTKTVETVVTLSDRSAWTIALSALLISASIMFAAILRNKG